MDQQTFLDVARSTTNWIKSHHSLARSFNCFLAPAAHCSDFLVCGVQPAISIQISDNTNCRIARIAFDGATSVTRDIGGQTLRIHVAEDLSHRDVIIDDIVANFFRRVGWITIPILLILLATDIVIFRRAVIPLLNAGFDPNTFSAGLMGFITEFVPGRQGLAEADARDWAEDLKSLGDDYFFSLNRYLFLAVR